MGTSRRIGLLLACGLSQTFAGGGGYAGLDRFGRVVDLHYKDGGGATIHRYQYGYDLAGNRTFARVTQAADATTSHDNDRSWLYAYDALNRLIDAQLGRLDSANASLATSAPTSTGIHWYLDNLGNWSGGDGFDRGRVMTQHSTIQWQTHVQAHNVNPANQITQLRTDATTHGVKYDPAGNLVCDGTTYYQYDAFNHLLTVHPLGTARLDDSGHVWYGQLGPLTARFLYDGLGRLIAKVSPEQAITPGLLNTNGSGNTNTNGNTNGEANSSTNSGGGSIGEGGDEGPPQTVEATEQNLQTKRFYYDGVRRIAEVVTRHDESMPVMANDELADADSNGTLDAFEQAVTWTDREYVYGPGDVDEFVCQIDRDGRVLYMLQDANLNVVALLGCSTGASPVVLEQYTWDPYGQVLARDVLDADANGNAQHAVNRVGFQGLFFDRLNGTATDAALDVSTPTAPVQGLYYSRNRSYNPTLGRFMQRDPNETALPIIEALAFNAQQSLGTFGGVDVVEHYADGMSLYQFASGNPLNARDPTGLAALLVGELEGDYWETVIWTAGAATAGLAANALLQQIARIGSYQNSLLMFEDGVSAMMSGATHYGESLMSDAVSVGVYAASRLKDCIIGAKAKAAILMAHLVNKVWTGGPDHDPNHRGKSNLKRQVDGFIAQVRVWVMRMPKGCDTQLEWLKYLEDVVEWLKNTKTPPPMPPA